MAYVISEEFPFTEKKHFATSAIQAQAGRRSCSVSGRAGMVDHCLVEALVSFLNSLVQFA